MEIKKFAKHGIYSLQSENNMIQILHASENQKSKNGR